MKPDTKELRRLIRTAKYYGDLNGQNWAMRYRNAVEDLERSPMTSMMACIIAMKMRSVRATDKMWLAYVPAQAKEAWDTRVSADFNWCDPNTGRNLFPADIMGQIRDEFCRSFLTSVRKKLPKLFLHK